ncbi:MAG: hypothetical protein LBQ58_08185 [Synergistaceae bacterium]|jgi:hypothetical protein|nr:hypothetical protein [Synergistaceae bacterium]
MARFLSEIGRKLSRLFLGRIVVRELGQLRREEPAMVSTHFRCVSIKPMRVEPRIGAALFVKWKSSAACSAGSLLGLHPLKNFKINGVALGVMKRGAIKRYKFNIKQRAGARNAIGRMKRIPSTRHNRLGFIKKQPKFEKASLLALYTPIFQEKVAKSALDKASGNLLFWYDNERVKQGSRYHLLLLRVFGGDEPLKWVWLPAEKKLN